MSNRLRISVLAVLLISYMAVLTSCSDKSADISILGDQDVFYQSSSVNNKIDILFMVDSSGSMDEEQTNLATNFNAFISDFVTKGYDYHIAVGATDAWRYEYSPGTYGNLSRFRDGNIYTGGTGDNTGVFMLDTLVANVINLFNTNVRVGITGSGDERAFDSIVQTLTSPVNTGYNFRRNDAYLAVVIISDENDFSRNDPAINGCSAWPLPATCQDANLRPVSDYVTFLDTYTSSVPADRKYLVSSIGVFDAACLAANPSSNGHMGTRYLSLVDAVTPDPTMQAALKGSICDVSFATTLNNIQVQIAEQSTQFRLSRTPVLGTIVVTVNGSIVPENAVNGWTYNATNNSIVFHGSAIPAQGAQISIDFDPTTLN